MAAYAEVVSYAEGRKSLLWPGASQWRIYYHRMWGQLPTACSNVLKQPNGELLVAVNHNQLRTMESETVDPIDWSHPPPSWAVPPERHVHSINLCNLSGTRTCNRSMRGNHLAYAATQGIYHFIYIPGRGCNDLYCASGAQWILPCKGWE